jgi:hypothetical protein
MSRFSAAARSSSAGDGGAPPVAIRTGVASCLAAGSCTSEVTTVGAAQQWVTDSDWISDQAAAGSGRARQTWVAPAAVTAHGKHHPLQWNIGSVHR